MLWVVFAVLMAIWILALASAITLGGFIHLLPVIALTVLLAQFANSRRIV
jgi:Family of unknown function (DUF5670)